MITTRDDFEVLCFAEMANGPRAVGRAVVLYYGPLLHPRVKRICGEGDGEDIFQAAMLGLLLGGAFERLTGHTCAWWARYWTRRAWTNIRQKQRRGNARVVARQVEHAASGAVDPERRLQDKQKLQALVGLIPELPNERDRVALQLTVDGVDEEQIAAKLGLTVKAVRVIVCRARQRLLLLAEARGLGELIAGLR